MDSRTTLQLNETFVELLKNCYQGGLKASMILDEKGLARVEGYISRLQLKAPIPYIELEGGCKIALHTVTALNGIFLPTYSEC